jgi:hypothetical protein
MKRIILFPMLTLTLLFAPALCRTAEPNTDQAQAIAAIERLGGNVIVDDKSPGKRVIAVNLMGTRVTDAGLEQLAGLPELRDLNLAFTDLTGSGLAHLKGMTKLQTLSLGWSKVTDATLTNLKRLTSRP